MLTKRQIDALRFNPTGHGKQILWDRDLPGYGVRVFATGRKAFVLRYRTTTGRDRFFTVGQYGVLTPDEARKKAIATLRCNSGGS
jgi:hypothetical protein